MQPALIAQTRDVLSRIGCMSWIENVVGAASHMDADAVILRGTMFGLHVDRGRKFETSFPVTRGYLTLKWGTLTPNLLKCSRSRLAPNLLKSATWQQLC